MKYFKIKTEIKRSICLKLLFALLFSFILYSCSSPSITVKNSTPITQSDTTDYAGYWTAVLCGKPELAPQKTNEPDKLLYAEVLQSHMYGENSAIKLKQLDSLVKNCKNDTLLHYAKYLLGQIYSINDRTEDYREIFRKDGEPDSALNDRLNLTVKDLNTKTPLYFSKDVDTIPLELNLGIPFIKVKINGKEYNFIFDTGFTLSAISTDLLKECKIDTVRSMDLGVTAVTGKTVRNSICYPESIEFANVKASNHKSLVLKSEDLIFKMWFITFLKIDGAIGLDIIRKLDVDIDYKNKKVIIRKPQKKENRNKNLFLLDDPMVKLKAVDGTDLFFLFDSGAKTSEFHPIISDKLEIAKGKQSEERIWGVGGVEKMKYSEIPLLSIYLLDKEITFENYKLFNGRAGLIYTDGRLGSDIGKQNTLHLDFLNGIFEIK